MARVKKDTALPQHLSTYEGFVNSVTDEYPKMSPRFQQVARFLLQNPNIIAMQSINSLAEQCGTHPSIIVRFAQSFGYSGFKQLQTIFQAWLSSATPGYHQRINALQDDLKSNANEGNVGFLKQLVARDISALETLVDMVSEDMLQQSAMILSNCDTIYIAGHMRSDPIARFFRYVLSMLKKKVTLLDPAGGLALEMARIMGPNDAFIAISFRHYAKEVVAISDIAHENKTPSIIITDSQLSPLAKNASVLYTIPEDEYSFSRSLAAPMSLSLSICIALAAKLQEGEMEDGKPLIPMSKVNQS
ncbi:MurR/RpiR family transcriptional regulator [Bartonella sp. HY329]|uniref:MurR/RpiR family transcriptional regulator n=1 Tax=unclassified Bartonella TaxID=2645622 RepID=UPI0021C74FCC|nr:MULTISPECIES: MurR/RpiR family transcriptional regulator [unclassified Bartonella]UXM94414.1 MurR/RpiR family transcriptional regulator [Bartonella sp. HY329]UXN08738.1 MurR/RpiR family transcriptional regulator [Bartonella sp. HY328]